MGDKIDYQEEIELAFHIIEQVDNITHPILLRALIEEIKERLEKQKG